MTDNKKWNDFDLTDEAKEIINCYEEASATMKWKNFTIGKMFLEPFNAENFVHQCMHSFPTQEAK